MYKDNLCHFFYLGGKQFPIVNFLSILCKKSSLNLDQTVIICHLNIFCHLSQSFQLFFHIPFTSFWTYLTRCAGTRIPHSWNLGSKIPHSCLSELISHSYNSCEINSERHSCGIFDPKFHSCGIVYPCWPRHDPCVVIIRVRCNVSWVARTICNSLISFTGC